MTPPQWRSSTRLPHYDSVYQKYNALIDENEYGIKYDIPHAHMFVIEGLEKVRDVIEKNRTRKLTKHKKLSNNTIIEIEMCIRDSFFCNKIEKTLDKSSKICGEAT